MHKVNGAFEQLRTCTEKLTVDDGPSRLKATGESETLSWIAREEEERRMQRRERKRCGMVREAGQLTEEESEGMILFGFYWWCPLFRSQMLHATKTIALLLHRCIAICVKR